MTTTESSIDCDVPVSVAYAQWTQFETFPHFMEGVESITQTTEKENHWKVKILGVEREFDTTITEQIPDERIAWKSTDGQSHAGVITFHKLSDTSCRLMLQLDYSPEGLVENVGDKLGIVSSQAKSDLERFKKFIEDQGAPTGAWQGEIDRDSGSVSSTSGVYSSGTGAGTDYPSDSALSPAGQAYPTEDSTKISTANQV